jgi:glycine/D-amino acid oxidase-like deaminating enzyme
VPCRLLTSRELQDEEPNLAPGFAGGLLVPEDSVVYPPAVALDLALRAQQMGTTLLIGRSVTRLGESHLTLDDGTTLSAHRIVLALGADAIRLRPDLPIRKRKGHLVITDRYPGFVHHQLVELGYLKSAHSVSADSVAFNVQPRQTGQLLIGSSRQFGAEHADVDQPILSSMLARAALYLPGISRLSAIRVWTGFRAATPDKLPLIGPDRNDPSLLLATGHEGLGITTSLATAELIADMLTGRASAIRAENYLPARYDSSPRNEDKHEVDWSHAGVDDGI